MPPRKPPTPPHRPMPPPPDLSPTGAELWAGLAGDLAAVQDGAVAEVDLVLLEMLVRQLDRLTVVRASVAAEGVTVVGSKCQVRPNPLLGVAAGLERDVVAGMERLGLTRRRRWGTTVTPEGRLERPAR